MSAGACAVGWSVAVGGVALTVMGVAGVVPWLAAIPGAVAAVAGASASVLSVRRVGLMVRPISISPQQAMGLGIPLPGERSTRFAPDAEPLSFPRLESGAGDATRKAA